MSDLGEPTLTEWQDAFNGYVHPHFSGPENLWLLRSRLSAAAAFIAGLDCKIEWQVKEGVAVALKAGWHVAQVYTQLGLPTTAGLPTPSNLPEAGAVVASLLEQVGITVIVSADEPADVTVPRSPPGGATDLEVEKVRRPVVHKETFEVEYGGRCFLGNTLLFKLFDFLKRRPGHYYSTADLQQGVWGPRRLVAKNTIQKTVGRLKEKLIEAGLTGIEIDGEQTDHYAIYFR